jgi:hypothetical protein
MKRDRLKAYIRDRENWSDWLIITIVFFGYLYHAFQMGDWIMDDAGISFVYSRNMAQGHGLVAQPGRAPVEGYSNPLWVLIFVPFFWLNLFDPILTPKVVSAVLILVSLVFLYDGSRKVLKSRFLGAVVIALTVSHTSFTVWTISGMENPLYVLITVLMFWAIVTSSERRGLASKLGILTGLAAITRPEGILFILVFPLYLLLEKAIQGQDKGWELKKITRDFGRFLLPFIVIFGGYFIFRVIYFQDILPNTFYAKGENAFSLIRWLRLITLHESRFEKILQIVEMVLGRLAVLGLLYLVISLTHFLSTRRFLLYQWAALILFLPGALAYVMLPADWMGEFRFATTVIPVFYIFLVQTGEAWLKYVPIRSTWKPWILGFILLAFLGINVNRHIRRTQIFAVNPPTPFLTIVQLYGERYNRYAEVLELDDASILLPDMGGTLYYSNLTVYDLGALTDRTIARTLRHDTEAFHDYVFEEIKPTFIVMYSGWAQFAEFDKDARFRQDYAPIEEQLDELLQVHGIEMFSGRYVRLDALADISQLELLR